MAGAQAQLGLFTDQYIEEVINEMERNSAQKLDLCKVNTKNAAYKNGKILTGKCCGG